MFPVALGTTGKTIGGLERFHTAGMHPVFGTLRRYTYENEIVRYFCFKVHYIRIDCWTCPSIRTICMKNYHDHYDRYKFSYGCSDIDAFNDNILLGISVYGKDIMTVIDQPFDIQDMLNISPQGKRTVVYEARYLKALFLKLQMS